MNQFDLEAELSTLPREQLVQWADMTADRAVRSHALRCGIPEVEEWATNWLWRSGDVPSGLRIWDRLRAFNRGRAFEKPHVDRSTEAAREADREVHNANIESSKAMAEASMWWAWVAPATRMTRAAGASEAANAAANAAAARAGVMEVELAARVTGMYAASAAEAAAWARALLGASVAARKEVVSTEVEAAARMAAGKAERILQVADIRAIRASS